MAVQVEDHKTFEEFLEAIKNRPTIRLVKLAEFGFVSPLGTSTGAIVMAPQIKVVATAFDRQDCALIRWKSTGQINQGSTIAIGMAKGIHGDIPVVARKEDLAKWLELEGFAVSDGEWTPAEIEQMLALR